MNNAYRQGFMEKCAEYGVDPGQLVKTALSLKLLNKRWLARRMRSVKAARKADDLKFVRDATGKQPGKVTPEDFDAMFGEGPDFNPLSLFFG